MQAIRETFATRVIDNIDYDPSSTTAAPALASVSYITLHNIRTIHLSLMSLIKKWKRIELSTCQHPLTYRIEIVARETSCTSQVLSTAPAIPCHTNCLHVPRAAAQEIASHSVNILSKLAFLTVGVKEMLTCIPKLDEHLFATVTYDSLVVCICLV